MELGQWLVLSLVSFMLFLFFTLLTYMNTPDSAPSQADDISEWFWWSTTSLKRTVYYSLSMVFFFMSLGLCICGIIENRRRVEHIKL